MFLNLLAEGRGVGVEISENWLVVLVGLIFVFLVMAFLIFIVWGTGKLMPHLDRLSKHYNKWKEERSAERAAAGRGRAQQKDEVAAVGGEEDEIAAVMAAIYATLDAAGEENTEKQVSFRVRRIR